MCRLLRPCAMNLLPVKAYFLSVLLCLISGVCAAKGEDGSDPLGLASACCSVLHAKFPSLVSAPGDAIYKQEQTGKPFNGYWARQESDLQPACRFTPTTSRQVAQGVASLVSHNCTFAIRGGGHTSWAGAANIGPQGLTIDLSSMKQVNVSSNHQVVSIGGGARWSDVYGYLDTLGLAVSGGRVSTVGVGGLTTGGGKSFFASKRGFACDNVLNFEVVTGKGVIVQANANKNPKLFKALKGGSNNFGIVTRFDFETFKQGKMWGGAVYYDGNSSAQQFQAMANFINATSAVPYPLKGDAELILGFTTASSVPLITNFYTYSLPESNPAIFKEFLAIKPQILNSTRVTQLHTLAYELGEGAAYNNRDLFATLTFSKNDPDLFMQLYQTCNSVFQPLYHPKTGVKNIIVSFVFQPVSKASLSRGCGKNSLGLCPSKDDLVLINLTVQWSSKKDDAKVYGAASELIGKARSMAKKKGALSKYVYLNYASRHQDPISSYGAENVAEMKAVSKMYDPEQVFQRLVPGGFKLFT